MLSMDEQFPRFLSSFDNSFGRQLIISKLYLCTGTASVPIARILFFALNPVPNHNINLLKYSFSNSSSSFICFMSYLSSMLKYLYAILGSSSLMSSNVLPNYVLLWILPFLNIFLHNFLIQNSYQWLC